ncbi:MAG: NADH-quinone oxidoreductase subunit J [Ignavibacteriales bacterium]|nr:hypothetical protein [Ignavibacteriaceae bacterium]MCK6612716.1 NADH-quinone oxidoreductase subunit J [Ignavibacteriaceae bacterium]QOJ29549.1 MAG: NADH-quinone oxidoreductase subunit J [Ignavibacteriales bacterium]
MSLETILFYFFATICAVTAVLVVSRREPVISALFLVLNFAALAGIYVTLFAQFIAVVQVIVYAGAIMVLFLFVIMLLRPEKEKSIFSGNPTLQKLSIGVGVLVFAQLIYIIIAGTVSSGKSVAAEQRIRTGEVEFIGRELITNYLLPFEAIAFLLLAATIGALVISKKKFE